MTGSATPGDDQVGVGAELVWPHVKVRTNPSIAVEQTVTSMQQAYEAVDVRVYRVSTETLNLPTLNDVDGGGCARGVVTAAPTPPSRNGQSSAKPPSAYTSPISSPSST